MKNYRKYWPSAPITCVLMVLLLTIVLPNRAEAEVPNDRERVAERALEQGDRLQRQGRHREAIEAWRGGFRAMPSWVLMLRIGNAYRQIGECDRAITYLRAGLANRDERFTDQMMSVVQGAIDECMDRLPTTLELSSNRGGVSLFVDDEPVGTSPLSPLRVSPGAHSVRGTRDGYADVNTTVRVIRGESAFVRLTMTEIGGSAENQRDDPELELQARRRRGRIWAGVLLGTGLALAGGGAAMIALDGYVVEEGNLGLSSLGIGTILLGFGVAAIAGGMTLFWVPPPERSRRDSRD